MADDARSGENPLPDYDRGFDDAVNGRPYNPTSSRYVRGYEAGLDALARSSGRRAAAAARG